MYSCLHSASNPIILQLHTSQIRYRSKYAIKYDMQLTGRLPDLSAIKSTVSNAAIPFMKVHKVINYLLFTPVMSDVNDLWRL